MSQRLEVQKKKGMSPFWVPSLEDSVWLRSDKEWQPSTEDEDEDEDNEEVMPQEIKAEKQPSP